MPYINLLGTFIFIIIGYVIGSISPSILISKKKFKSDIRTHYSKNAGATNAFRVMGKKWGIMILLIDGLKPIIAVLIAFGFTFINITNPKFSNLFSQSYVYFSGLAVLVGHCWPIFFKFHGGKAAASSLGLLLIINPIYFAAALISWWIIVYISKMASLASILMIGIAFIISWIPNLPLTAFLWPHDKKYFMINIIIFLSWLIIIFQHRKNIKLIFKGKERKVKLFDKKPQDNS